MTARVRNRGFQMIQVHSKTISTNWTEMFEEQALRTKDHQRSHAASKNKKHSTQIEPMSFPPLLVSTSCIEKTTS